MSKDKKTKAKPAGSGGAPAWLVSAAHAVKQPLLWMLTIYVLYKWILPWLADLTPPGVDLELIKREAEQRALLKKDKCATVCDGMTCPDGWTTGRAPDDRCKCICVRKDPNKATEWDKEHGQAKYFEDREPGQATTSRHDHKTVEETS